jgi:hypothetical protein
MLHYRLVLARIDLANADERAVGRRAFERMVEDVPLAIRKARNVIKGKGGKGGKRYEELTRWLRDRLAADFAALEAESATLGVQLHPDFLAINTFGFVEDVVERLAAAN